MRSSIFLFKLCLKLVSSTGSTLLHSSQAQPISQAARPLPQEESSDHICNSSMSSTCASRRIYSRYTTALNPASFRIPNPRQNCELEELDFWTLHLAQHTESFCVYLWNLLCANSHSTPSPKKLRRFWHKPHAVQQLWLHCQGGTGNDTK